MGITSALVLYAVFWFMVLFLVLPVGLKTQGDVGEVVPGTPASSPEGLNLRRKLWIVTLISAVLWVITATIIITGAITISDFDLFNRFGPGDSPVFPVDGTSE